MPHENCHAAAEALTRIDAHEDICDLRYRHIAEGMERMDTAMGKAHKTMQEALVEINRTILRVLVWLTVVFGGSVVGLVIYIYTHPRGLTP